jgi:hypothetical protein
MLALWMTVWATAKGTLINRIKPSVNAKLGQGTISFLQAPGGTNQVLLPIVLEMASGVNVQVFASPAIHTLLGLL